MVFIYCLYMTLTLLYGCSQPSTVQRLLSFFFFFFFIYFILGFGNWNHMHWVLEREVYNTFIIMIFQQYDITA